MYESVDNNENLCKLYVLGVTDVARDDLTKHQDSKDRLRESKVGWYENGLTWKNNSILLQTINWVV